MFLEYRASKPPSLQTHPDEVLYIETYISLVESLGSSVFPSLVLLRGFWRLFRWVWHISWESPVRRSSPGEPKAAEFLFSDKPLKVCRQHQQMPHSRTGCLAQGSGTGMFPPCMFSPIQSSDGYHIFSATQGEQQIAFPTSFCHWHTENFNTGNERVSQPL